MNWESRKALYFTCLFLGCFCVIVIHLLSQKTSLLLMRSSDSPCPMPGAGIFMLKAIPSTALVSFPGSGNHWTRFLLTTASGVLTGAVYDEVASVHINLQNKRKPTRVIAVKTHKLPKATRGSFVYDRCILLIRNPYEALLAEFNRRKSHTAWPRQSTFIVSSESFKEWPNYVSSTMNSWRALYLGWLAECRPPHLHVLVYSRMKEDLHRELEAVFRFLNESSITPRVHCAVLQPEGNVHRKDHSWQEQLAVFSEQQKRVLNGAIDDVRGALENVTGESFEDIRSWKR